MKKFFSVFFCLFPCFFVFAISPAGAASKLVAEDYVIRVAAEKESLSNKVDSFEGEISDNTQYPSALAVKTALDTKLNSADLADKISEAITVKEDVANKVVNFENADDTKYPSALAVKTALDTKVDVGAEAVQTLNGNYTVAGSLIVPTQPLP